MIWSGSAHYPVLRPFLCLLYSVLKSHKIIATIDEALGAGDVERLMDFMQNANLFNKDGTNSAAFCNDNSTPGLGPIESYLRVTYAELIADLESQYKDDPVYPCLSCERLHQQKQVSCVNLRHDTKYQTAIWLQLKNHIGVVTNDLYVCSYCRQYLNKNTMPPRCILNGLITEPVPDELKGLDALSKQLIQRAKAFQTLVRLGTYSGNQPAHNSLQACKGIMFYLPLPLYNTFETVTGVEGNASLPDPQLYVIVNGVPTKDKVVWQTLVDVDRIKAAIQKLSSRNWLYSSINDFSLSEMGRKVVEVFDNTSSCMIEKLHI